MAFSVGQLSAAITADMKGFNTAMRQVRRKGTAAANSITKKFEQMGPKMERIGRGLTLGLTLPIAGIGTAMVKTASDAEETQQKFDVVFKDISKAATQTSKDLQQSFGLSSKSANKLLGDVGDILTGFGFTQETALGLSKQVNELAVDLASFTNFVGGAEGASRALTKALLGEAESVKALGIVIRQDTEEYKALVEQIQRAKNVGIVQAKALAALQIAQEQSKNATGDFARTQGSLANQMRQLKEDVTDLSVAFGKQLTPAVNRIVGVVRGAVNSLTDMSETGKVVTIAFSGLLAVVGPILTALGFMAGQIKNLIPIMKKLKGGVVALTGALKTGAIALTGYVGAIAALGVATFKANQRTQEQVNAISDSVKQITSAKAANEELIRVEQRLAKTRQQMAKGVQGLGQQLESLLQKRDALIDRRDELFFQEAQFAELKTGLQDLDRFNAMLRGIASLSQEVSIKKPFIEAKRPMDEIIPALDMVEQGFREMSSAEILASGGALNLGSAMEVTTKKAKEASQVGQQMGQMLGQAFSQTLLHAKNLGNVISNLAKQFASRILMRGLSLLLGGGLKDISGLFGKNSFFGGMFHSGGVVPGSGSKLVRARGGEGIFTPSQMASMGNLGGSQISTSSMQKSFEKALSNHIRGVSDRKIFEMAEKGRFG